MTIKEIQERIDQEIINIKNAHDALPAFSKGWVIKYDKTGIVSKTEEMIPKSEYSGAGLPMCEKSCSECQGRAENWAEIIGCTPEEIWEAMND